jgi:ATP-dependent exoDNAse (exonuclease V) alpha subunit
MQEEIKLNEGQIEVFNQINTSINPFFITGGAGTGKSTLLKYLVRNTNKKVAVLAPTGIAALNVDGQTIHSFFGIDHNNIKAHTDNESLIGGIKNIEMIILDEVSMLRADLFDELDIICKKFRNNNLFFGGIQVVMFGDLYQLPPITESKNKTSKDQLRALKEIYGPKENNYYFFIFAKCFMRNIDNFTFSELKLNERQKGENEYLNLLNKIRVPNQNLLNKDFDILNARVQSVPKDDRIIITATNDVANFFNKQKLDELKTELLSSSGKVHDIHSYKEISDKLPERYLKFKIGAKILMCMNDKVSKRWVNGTLAIIESVEMDEENTFIKAINITIGSNKQRVLKETWYSNNYTFSGSGFSVNKKKIFTQFPFKLGWAITIHKSQGQTYEKMHLNISDGWAEHGLYYVALSRAKSLDGISVEKNINKDNVAHSFYIDDFMEKFFNQEKKITIEYDSFEGEEYNLFTCEDEIGMYEYHVLGKNFHTTASDILEKNKKGLVFFDKEGRQVDLNFIDEKNIKVSVRSFDSMSCAERSVENILTPLELSNFRVDKKYIKLKIKII